MLCDTLGALQIVSFMLIYKTPTISEAKFVCVEWVLVLAANILMTENAIEHNI